MQILYHLDQLLLMAITAAITISLINDRWYSMFF